MLFVCPVFARLWWFVIFSPGPILTTLHFAAPNSMWMVSATWLLELCLSVLRIILPYWYRCPVMNDSPFRKHELLEFTWYKRNIKIISYQTDFHHCMSLVFSREDLQRWLQLFSGALSRPICQAHFPFDFCSAPCQNTSQNCPFLPYMLSFLRFCFLSVFYLVHWIRLADCLSLLSIDFFLLASYELSPVFILLVLCLYAWLSSFWRSFQIKGQLLELGLGVEECFQYFVEYCFYLCHFVLFFLFQWLFFIYDHVYDYRFHKIPYGCHFHSFLDFLFLPGS